VQLRSAGVPYSQAVHDFRKQFIWTLLARHHGNQCKAAKALGVHRNTIKHMLNKLGIDPNEFRAPLASGLDSLSLVDSGLACARDA
jgi:Fis family transcriptional regulator, factor for inversion stimulation protein